MKLKAYIKGFVAAMLMLPIAGLVSCEDQPDKFELTGGTPTVNYIRMPYLAQADSLIDEASLGTVICMVGDNLTSIKELLFNDQKAQLNTSYITNHTLIVQIPDDIPDLVSDKIFMVTSGNDTVSYDFHVIVPAPNVSAMSCEFAPAGSEVTITGNYFVDDPNVPIVVTLPDGQTISGDDIKNLTSSSLSFIMPECTTEGTIDVTTIYGTTSSSFHYLDSRGMMFDFDGKTGLGASHGWHARDVLSDETSITGNFVQLGNGTAKMTADGGWDDTNFSFEYWCGSWDSPQNITSGDGIALYNLPDVDLSNPENMSLKFEMYIPSAYPWMAGAMQIAFEGVDKVTLSGNPITDESDVAGANAYVFNGEDSEGVLGDWGRALYRPWTTTGSYDTGDQWITVTIPIKNFSYTRTGGAATLMPSTMKDFASLTMFVVGGGVNGTECTPIIKIDNIRVVPN